MNKEKTPFTIDVKELKRQPGTSEHKNLSILSFEDYATTMVSTAPQTPMKISVRLESVHEGILATGQIETTVLEKCSRCLSENNKKLEASFQELFYYPEHLPEPDDDNEYYEIQDDSIDIDQIVRDAVVSQFSFNPVCSPECQGLCSECGKTLSDGHEHQDNFVDDRWKALEDFTIKLDSSQ